MKRHLLHITFCIALAASSAIVSEHAPIASSSGSFVTTFTTWVSCTFGDKSSCLSPDTTTDPMIKNN